MPLKVRLRGSTLRARTVRAGTTVLVALALVALAPSIVRASTRDRIDAIRAEIDAAAQDYFDAQRTSAALDERISELESRIARSGLTTARLRRVAEARVVELYIGTGALQSDYDAETMLDIGRRTEFIESANADALGTIDTYVAAAQDARSALEELERRRDEQRAAVAELGERQADLDAALADARADLAAEQAAAVAAAEAAARAATSTTATAPSAGDPTGGSQDPGDVPDDTTGVTSPGTGTSPTDPPATTAPTSPPTTTVPPPPPPPGQHPHHNDPFLSCVRQRESRGIYTAVNPAGYYGAYQFAPSTWDATAAHAGRMSLVGVRPDRAGVWDQDDMAWTLYQWQGASPWGGHCP